MGDYTEHLISMAGGDGDELDQIQRRIKDCQTYKFGMYNADKLAHEDAPHLLALVREQHARIERALVLANSSPNAFLGRDIRAALTATDQP